MRFGLGPVFAYERLVNARRWQTYAARSFMVAALLVAMATIAVSYTGLSMGSTAQRYARLGESRRKPPRSARNGGLWYSRAPNDRSELVPFVQAARAEEDHQDGVEGGAGVIAQLGQAIEKCDDLCPVVER
jgi:hypothetical protein